MARWLMFIGALLLIIGAIWQFAPGLFNWFGKLPGDIHIHTERSRIFIPITSTVIVSLIVTVLVNLLKRFF